eukprot:267437-Karenia_brevis.AAC.1
MTERNLADVIKLDPQEEATYPEDADYAALRAKQTAYQVRSENISVVTTAITNILKKNGITIGKQGELKVKADASGATKRARKGE